MALTPLDIHNKEFGKAFRGYDEEEVDEFLDEVVRDYETVYKENINLKEALAAKDSNIGQYKDLEETLKKTLVVAQQTAEDIKGNAAREAEVILQEARLKAEQIIAAAEEKGHEIVQNYETLQKVAQHLRVKLRSFLHSQLALVDEKESLLAVDEEQQSTLAAGENEQQEASDHEFSGQPAPDAERQNQLTLIEKLEPDVIDEAAITAEETRAD